MEQKAEQQKTVLIVEDEKNIVDILRFNLQREGYRTVEAYDGADGLEKARSENPDIILLDVMLPKMIGFDVCRTLRDEGNNVPVIILTAREEEADKVLGLEIGADDYITKPFSLPVLYAKVEALVRRANGQTDDILTAGRVQVDTAKRQAFVDGRPISLAPKVYDLLLCLLRQKGRIFSREQLLDGVWGLDHDGSDRVVDNHIKKLRKALGPCAGYIRTVTGIGYGLEEHDDE